jgi:hypothetical protein
LHHTSGVRDWPGLFVLQGRRFDDVISFHDILKLTHRQKDLSFSPGEMYAYSNTGYNLLARSIETITGNTFSSWVQQNILTHWRCMIPMFTTTLENWSVIGFDPVKETNKDPFKMSGID